MGVRGLYSYIIKTSEGSFEPFTLKNTKIIIDGQSLSYRLFNFSQRNRTTKYIIGSDYEAFSRYVTDFFKTLMYYKVNFLLVMNGCVEPENRDEFEQKHTKRLPSNFDPFLYDRKEFNHFYSAFKDDVFLSAIKKLKIKFVKCTFNSNEVISVTSKILGYPILTASSDYILYGNDCIFFHTIKLDRNTLQLTNQMACKIYRSDKFIKSFPGLDISCLSLLSALMDQNYFNDELLKEILKFESSDDEMIENYNKIQAGLNWLSHHTLESASSKICSLLTPVGESPEPIKKFIEAHINRFTTLSKLTLEFLVTEQLLQITEEKISSVEDKFFKFTMDNKKKSPSEKLHDKLVKRDDDIIKRKVLSLTPDWLLRCHRNGHIHSFILSMIGLRTFIPWDHLEDLDYPCAYEISISLIELIDRLLLSCMKNYSLQPLNLITKNWRLYVATAVFWFKQDVAPYYQIEVEQILMRPLIYNLYLDISQHSDVDKYIADKLNHAPTVLKCFKVLSKKVDSLLNE